MDSQRYASHLAHTYDRSAAHYRADDELEVRTENHRRLGANLRRICRAFPHPVRVLEIGCGTGRFFHWLDNVRLLVGTDLSAEMLKRAAHPVHADQVTAQEIRLVQGNIYEMDFAAGSFDFVYSLGMFGYGAAWTQPLCDRVHRWLSETGRLFFNAIEVPHSPNRMHRFKERVKTRIYPKMPSRIRRWLREREVLPIVRHSHAQIERVMERAGFSDFTISSHACRSPLWNGVHLECSAQKDRARARDVAPKAEAIAA